MNKNKLPPTMSVEIVKKGNETCLPREILDEFKEQPKIFKLY